MHHCPFILATRIKLDILFEQHIICKFNFISNSLCIFVNSDLFTLYKLDVIIICTKPDILIELFICCNEAINVENCRQ